MWDAVSPAVRKAGVQAGAVAEVTVRLLTADAEAVVSPLDDIVVGASLEQLRRPAERVAIISAPTAYRRRWPLSAPGSPPSW